MHACILLLTLPLLGLATVVPVHDDQYILTSSRFEEDDFAPICNIDNLPKYDIVCHIGGVSEKTFTPNHTAIATRLALQQLADGTDMHYGDPEPFTDFYEWFPHCDNELMVDAYIGGFADEPVLGGYRVVFEYLPACNAAKFCGLVYHHGYNGPFELCYGEYDYMP